MSNLRNLFSSPGYKSFMFKLLIMALIVFVLGIIFILCHLKGGETMAQLGGSTLLVWLVFFILEKIMMR